MRGPFDPFFYHFLVLRLFTLGDPSTHHQPIGQPWLDNHDALRPVDADDALLRRVALPIGLALVALELRRGPLGNPGGKPRCWGTS